VTLIILLVAMFGAFLFGRTRAGRGYESVWIDSVNKSRLVGEIQTNLLASAEAEKSAVMAETDEASAAFAAESRRAAEAVEASRSALGELIATGGRSDELQMFRDLSSCWAAYRDVDREILRLAVENTNLKAQRLSFEPAPAALARMQSALDTLVAGSGTGPPSIAVVTGAYEAMTAALRIHGLEGRHIAEARDEEMGRIEAEMKTLDATVNHGLSTLSSLAGNGNPDAVEVAHTAYADFQKVHGEVLALSRRNSNVRSLAISLGQKRKSMAQCQDHLAALQEAVRPPADEATR
jgi:hypothetical protein